MTCPDADWTLKLNTGETNADLGMVVRAVRDAGTAAPDVAGSGELDD